MTLRLNGWQRLWVLLSIIAIFPVGYGAIVQFDDQQIMIISELEDLKKEAIRRNDKEVILTIEEKLINIDKNHNRELAIYISKSLAWWLICSIAIYIVGMSINWVRKGFLEK